MLPAFARPQTKALVAFAEGPSGCHLTSLFGPLPSPVRRLISLEPPFGECGKSAVDKRRLGRVSDLREY